MSSLKIERLEHAQGLELPSYQTPGSAGLDLRAATTVSIVLEPGARTLIPTGLKLAIPAGFEAQVRPRSGLALKHGLSVLNSPGTIDSDYRGEVKVILANLGSAPFTIERGMRIAQLVIAACVQVEIVEVDQVGATERGEGGFGHTGT